MCRTRKSASPPRRTGTGWRSGLAAPAVPISAKRLPRRPPRRGYYLQQRIAGQPISALLLANGRDAQVLGFSEQWAAPLPGRPFRYGGAVRPAALGPALASDMAASAARVASASGLIGLNSADFLVRQDGFTLLEVNPRPGATLDIFAEAEPMLFDMHVRACTGRLPEAMPVFPGAAGSEVVYVPRRCALPEGFAWPDWAADRQPPGIAVPAEGPLCTVQARADDAKSVRRLLRERVAEILRLAGMGQ